MSHTFINKLLMLLLVVISIIVGTYFAFKLIIIWLPLIFAWGISSILFPFVEGIVKKSKINRGVITFIFLIIFISLFLLIISAIGYLFAQQIENLIDRFPEMKAWFKEGNFSLNENLAKLIELLPESFREGLLENIPDLINSVNMSLTTILASIIGVVAIVPNLLVSIIVMFVAAFFMTKDKIMLRTLKRNFFDRNIFKHKLIMILREDVWMVFLGYVKAQLILMSITFTEVTIGLLILKIPYAVLIALAIGILDALPVFGTGAVFIPWIIVLIFYKNYPLAIGILTLYLIATLTRQSLEPKIISTQIGIHPLITLTVIYTGIKIFGVLGIVIAPLIGITLLAIKKSEILKVN